MSSRFVKITCAAALALPLAAVSMQAAQAETFPGENDCNHHFSGAVTQHPHADDRCYGIDQRIHHDGPSGDAYRGSTIVVADDKGEVHCNPGDLLLGIFYTQPGDAESFMAENTLSLVPGIDITPQDGVPNGASGTFPGVNGTIVTASCRDTA